MGDLRTTGKKTDATPRSTLECSVVRNFVQSARVCACTAVGRRGLKSVNVDSAHLMSCFSSFVAVDSSSVMRAVMLLMAASSDGKVRQGKQNKRASSERDGENNKKKSNGFQWFGSRARKQTLMLHDQEMMYSRVDKQQLLPTDQHVTRHDLPVICRASHRTASHTCLQRASLASLHRHRSDATTLDSDRCTTARYTQELNQEQD